MGELQLYGITNLALGNGRASSLTPDRDRAQCKAHRVAHLMQAAPGKMVALAGNVRF